MKRIAVIALVSILVFFVLNISIIFFTTYFKELPEPNFPETVIETTTCGEIIVLKEPKTNSLLYCEDISNNFLKAVIAIEDHRFYEHNGIDFLSISRAFISNIKNRNLVGSGGSTITQQFAKNAYPFLSSKKLFSRKISEAAAALRVEQKYSKIEILEFYCNIIYVGHGLHGVEAASNYYFGKDASALNLNEAATIAGLLKSPANYSPYVSIEKAEKNRNIVLSRMLELGFISPEVAAKELDQPIMLIRHKLDNDKIEGEIK